jgi:YHS domain-containing protein
VASAELVARILRAKTGKPPSTSEALDILQEGDTAMAKDPVCGMMVDMASAAATSEYQGQTYYFCCKGCKAAFDKEPEKYVSQSETAS